MNKKNLRFYEAPVCDIVELKVIGMLCGSTNAEGVTEDPLGD